MVGTLVVLSILEPPAWQADDREWFKANPGRSHRLRQRFPGETFGDSTPLAAPPPRHEFQVLVRQLEPGKRTRLPFCRNIDCAIHMRQLGRMIADRLDIEKHRARNMSVFIFGMAIGRRKVARLRAARPSRKPKNSPPR
jgi:hypothetical protein